MAKNDLVIQLGKQMQKRKPRELQTVLGLLLMLIPVSICLAFTIPEVHKILFIFSWKTGGKVYPLRPGLESTLLAVAFYFALILRYDFFRLDGIWNSIVSCFGFIINVFVLAAMLSPIYGSTDSMQKYLLLAAVGFTWVGMRSIAGFSWIGFIILFVWNIGELSGKLGIWGYVLVVLAALSLLLQSDVKGLRNFAADFKGIAAGRADDIRYSMQSAIKDASDFTMKLR